jgi:RNase H-fold protein (predicted Holliday junction resolvase)
METAQAISNDGELREKSDEDLMKLYVNQTLSRFPQMALVRDLTDLMRERNIAPKEIVVGFRFSVNGEDQIIQGISLKDE